MGSAVAILGWVTPCLLVLLVAFAVADHARQGGAQRAWLAASLALIGAVSLIGKYTDLALDEPSRLLSDLSLVLFCASGYALLEHRWSLQGRARAGLRPAIALVTIAATASGIAVRFPLEPGAPLSRKQTLALVAVIAVWAVSVLDPAVRLWRTGKRLPVLERVRLRLRAAGYGGLVVTLLGAFAIGGGEPPAPAAEIAIRALTIALLTALFLGVAPPASLRRRWLEREAGRHARALAAVGAWYWDVPSQAVAWSKELRQLFGAGADEQLTYTSFVDAVHPDDRVWVGELIEEHLLSQLPFEFDHRLADADGPTRWMHCVGQVVRDPGTGSTVAMYGTARDITERKHAEDAARRSSQHFRALVESAPDAAVVVNEMGRIVLVNDEATRLFGYSSDELHGERVDVLVPETMRDGHAALRQSFSEVPRRRTMAKGNDLFARRRDGTLFEVDVSLSPVQTEDGAWVIASVRDATERRQAERALTAAYEKEKSAAEELRRVDAMKDAFLEAVSHELRTPLTAVLGFGHTLERPGVIESGEGRDIARRIVTNAKRLDRLLSDLLDLDRITRGVLQPAMRRTNIGRLALTITDSLDLGGRELAIDVGDVHADVSPPHLERVIENLLVNALRHTPAAARLWLTVQAVVGGVLVSVEDEGAGIPDGIKDDIFLPFERGQGGVARARGTGLGLALVRQFTELHHGRAWVEDRPGGGAAFRVFLPEHATAQEAAPADVRAIAG